MNQWRYRPAERGTAMQRSPMGIRFLAALASGIVSAMLGSATAAAGGGPDLGAIDRYVRSEMDAQRIPGLALGIVHGNRIVHVQGFGQAHRSGWEVTPQTPFLIGSVTKSFTALAIMQLSESGRVQLDAPVQRYLPWWRVADPDASARVTVRHLLYQVSGLSKATGNAYATSGDTHESALEDRVRALRDAELTEPVGTTWQYSNANYWTLGMIVQAVSGQSYETYIQQHIFDPLEMRNSYTSQAESAQHGLPTGHRYWYGFPVAAELPFDRGGLGSGGLSSSAQDMTRYLDSLSQPWPIRPHRTGLTRRCRRAAAGRGPHRPGRRLLRDGLGRGPGPWFPDDLPRRQRLRLPRQRRPHPRPPMGRRGDGKRRELPRRVLRLASHDSHRQRRRRHAYRRGGTRADIVEPVAVGGLWGCPWNSPHPVRRHGSERADHPGVARRPTATPEGSPADRAPRWPASPGELELGPHRAGRATTNNPRAAARRPDGTARPRIPAGCQRRPCLRLGPGQSDLGNPNPADAGPRCQGRFERRNLAQLNLRPVN